MTDETRQSPAENVSHGTEHPFDPSNPFDATCERIRREVVQLAIDSEGITIYRELSPNEQIECLVAGVLTGLIGSCFAAVKPEAYDYIADYIAKSVPAARKFADQIKTADAEQLSGSHRPDDGKSKP